MRHKLALMQLYAALLSSVLITSCKSMELDRTVGSPTRPQNPDSDLPSLPTSPTQSSMPVGTIMPMSSSTCPSGWVEFTNGRGRALLGAGAGNLDADGNTLLTRTFGQNGGIEFTTGAPTYTAGVSSTNTPSPGVVLGIGGTSDRFVELGDGDPTTSLGVNTDSNLPPYMVLKYCEKVLSQSDSVGASEAIIYRDDSSCPSHWSAYTALNGRTTIGEGAGQVDVHGAALTPRTLGSVGGYEYTPGLRVSIDPGDHSNATPYSLLGRSASGNIFSTGSPDTTIGGIKADSNMPPFIALTVCSNDSTEITATAGTIVAVNLASCPSGWSDFAGAKGRLIFGTGAGTPDSNGEPLTHRGLNTVGGREKTTGIPARTAAADTFAPGATRYLSSTSGQNIYSNQPANNYLFGYITPFSDPNIPPYVVVTFCRKD